MFISLSATNLFTLQQESYDMKNKFKLIIGPLWIILLFLIPLSHYGQKSIIASVGFYNLENLFDIVNDTLTLDEEFTPQGDKNWTEEKYRDKLDRLSTVIKDIGTDYTPDGLAILGVSEIENKKVLEDLTQTANLKNRSYQIIHYNSPDDRGVDVALLYQEKYFHVVESKPYSILLKLANGDTKKTRDVLLVKGYLDQQLVYILVNHWPSRRGGEIITKPYRLQTAQLNKHIVDSLRSIHPDANYIIMGDLNDNPDNESLTVGIKAIGVKSKVGKEDFYNPFYWNFDRGEGSTSFNDSWSLFDQILISENLLHQNVDQFQFYKHQIYHKSFMLESRGHYKNHPKRTFSGNVYNYGYSDHFPVVVYLSKKAE